MHKENKSQRNPHRPARAALPKASKARVMYCNESELIGEYTFDVSKSADPSDDRLWTKPVLVQPFPTVSAARAAKRWADLSDGEKVERVAQVIFETHLAQEQRAAKDFPGFWLPWNKKTEPGKDNYRELARAVLTLTGHAPKAK